MNDPATPATAATVPPPGRPRLRPAAVAGLLAILALHLGLLVYTSTRKSICGDESPHLAAGLAYLQHGEMSIYNLSPPLLRWWGAMPAWLAGADVPPARHLLNELPSSRHWIYHALVERSNPQRIHRFVLWGRFSLIPLSLLCCIVIFAWSRRLYGDASGLLAAGVWAISPTVLANASMLGTDIGTGLTILAAGWAWVRFLQQPTQGRCLAVAALVAVAHTIKFTSVLLWPAMLLIALVYRGYDRGRRRDVLAAICICLLFTWVSLNACYGFKQMFARAGSYQFLSTALQSIQRAVPAATPVPFPRHLVEGFDAQKFEAEGMLTSTLFDHGYFGSEWPFYPLMILCKSTLGGLVMIGLVGVSLLVRKPNREEVSLLVLAGVILGGLFSLDINIGIRYLLAAYPVLMVLTGRLLTIPWFRLIALLAATAGAIESVVATPRFHSFYNVIARPYRYEVPDTGWGQSHLELVQWMKDTGEQSVIVYSTSPTSAEIYGLRAGDATAPITDRYVALTPTLLGGVPLKYRDGFVILRPWRALRTTPPVVDFGGLVVFRREDVVSPNGEPVFAVVRSWTEAMQVPEMAEFRDYDDRLRRGY